MFHTRCFIADVFIADSYMMFIPCSGVEQLMIGTQVLLNQHSVVTCLQFSLVVCVCVCVCMYVCVGSLTFQIQMEMPATRIIRATHLILPAVPMHK